jgi:DNA-directed RNA polymerase specialized sigma24 family protein
MSSRGSVSRCLADLKTGDEVATCELCERYFDQLVRLARKNLRAASRRVADEEDVVVSVLDSLCRGARRDRFPLLTDRDDLWRLLVVLTARKAANQIKHGRRLKRGSGKVRGDTAFGQANSGESERGIDGVIGKTPGPATLAELKEEFQKLLAALDDETLQQVAIRSMEGYTKQEIATMLGRSLSSINRKLSRIREIWRARQ